MRFAYAVCRSLRQGSLPTLSGVHAPEGGGPLRRLLLAAGMGAGLVAAGCGGTGKATPPASTSRGSSSASSTSPPAYRYMTDAADGAATAPYGYNLVDLSPDKSAIDALSPGQRALVWLGGYDTGSCRFSTTDATLTGQLAPLAGDGKVAGFYVADEPDDGLPASGGHCPDVASQVTARDQLVHRLAPGPFTYEVVTEPTDFAAFAHATDVLGADPYPCRVGRACDMSLIPRYVAALHAAHVTRFWGVLQAFSAEGWRYPTAGELRQMIAQWAGSGWQGEQTFAWRYAGRSLSDHPDLLGVLRSLNQGTPDVATAGAGGSGPRPATSPPLSKLLVIIDENHGDKEVYPSGMPYLAGLADQYGRATSYSDVNHPSLPNYLAVFSGSSFDDPQDCTPGAGCSYPGPTVFGQVLEAGRTARAYEESMTVNCATSNTGDYDVNHNPWAYVPSEAAQCRANDVPAGTTTGGALISDIRSGSLPTIGLLTPNLVDDAHNGTLADADGFLRHWVPILMSSPDWRAGRLAVAITFDEGDAGDVVPFVLLSPSLHHVVVTTPLTHYSLTRFMDEVAGVAPLRSAAGAPDLASAFGLPG
jgi:hypothetical protein